MIIPEVMMGEIPSSMRVPRFEARMTRIQKSGSDESEDMIPYRGIWEETRKMARTMAVHATFCWNGTVSRGNSQHGLRVNDVVSALSYRATTQMPPSNAFYSPFLSGAATSGKTDMKGRTRLRNLKPPPLILTKEEEEEDGEFGEDESAER